MKYIIFLILIITLYFLFTNKKIEDVKNYFKGSGNTKLNNLTMDQKFNSQRIDKQHRIDEILDKISKKGFGSLSSEEIKFLNDYSNE